MPADYTDDNLNDLLWRAPKADAVPTDAAEDAALWAMLSAYVDGEATPAETAEVEHMLHSDAEYAHAYEFMRQTSLGARSFVEIEPPAHLRDAIYAATSHRPTLTKRALDGWNRFRMSVGLPRIYIAASGTFAATALVLIALSGHHSAPVSNSSIALGAKSRTTASATNGNPSSHSGDRLIALAPDADFGFDTDNLFKMDALSNLSLSPVKQALPSMNRDLKQATGNKFTLSPIVKTPMESLVFNRPLKNNATPQHPVFITANVPKHDYSPNPNMDSSSVHKTQLAMVTAADSLHGHDDLGGAPIDTDVVPSKSSVSQDSAVAEPAKKNILIAKVDHSRIPPESRMSMSDALREATQRGQNYAHTALLKADSGDNQVTRVPIIQTRF